MQERNGMVCAICGKENKNPHQAFCGVLRCSGRMIKGEEMKPVDCDECSNVGEVCNKCIHNKFAGDYFEPKQSIRDEMIVHFKETKKLNKKIRRNYFDTVWSDSDETDHKKTMSKFTKFINYLKEMK